MDLRYMRISNRLIFCSFLTGFLLCLFSEGGGFGEYIAGIILPLILLGWLFFFRMLGPGDIKLLCALGGIMGREAILYCIGISFLAGAAISFAILVFCGGFCERMQYFYEYVNSYLRTGNRQPYYRRGNVQENFHFTVPIFMGVMLYAGGLY